MIIVRIRGGIGNQLFMYAAARRLSLITQQELVLDTVSGFVRDYTFQRKYQLDHFNIKSRHATPSERMEPFGRIRRAFRKKINSLKSYEEKNYLIQEGSSFDERLLAFKPLKNTYLEGYWQSERYFLDVAEIIRNDLVISPPTDQVNQSMAAKIKSCKSVAVHFRFFDLPGEEGVSNAGPSYYVSAIRKLQALVGSDTHFFIFSDRPDEAKSKLSLPDERLTVVKHNYSDEYAYADMWLMSLCQHFIIANSTFSWWCAWLGQNEGKVVIAPEVVMTEGKMSWGFDGLIPESWLTC